MQKILALLIVLSCCVDATFSWGRCPKPSLQSNFDITQYTGEWFELVRNKDMPYEKGNCDKANYSLESNGYLKVVNSEVVDGKTNIANGQAHCDASEAAQCYVKFSRLAPAGDYEVVSTDYTGHSVVFSCFSIGIAHWKWAWVLSRTADLDYTPFLPTIESLGIPESALYFTSQTNCP